MATLLCVVSVGYGLIFGTPTNAGLTFRNELNIPEQMFGTVVDGRRKFHLTVAEGIREFLPGLKTQTAGVNGPYLGPTLRLRRGENVDLTVENNLDEMTTMHWHGMHVPARMDGTPHQRIEPSNSWTASFEVTQQAAPLWYHPHPHGATGRQVYRGVSGFMWISDQNSDTLDLPKTYGRDDIPIVIQDRLFEDDGSFRFSLSQGAVYGDTLLVNGTWDPFLRVEARRIRFRILNGSNARTYFIGFSDNREFHKIATDGGFLEEPIATRRVILASGERAEILVDFSDGSEALLKSFPEAGIQRTVSSYFGRFGTEHFEILKIIPTATNVPSTPVPAKLNQIRRIDASEASRSRPMVLGGPIRRNQGQRGRRGRGGGQIGPPINGKVMDMSRIDEVVRLGDTEIWEVTNRSGQPHPFHVHLVQFQVLDRNGKLPTNGDLGWKDTVLVHPEELLRIIMRFEKYADPDIPYMYHCHIMEHEDNGMMGQFLVVENPSRMSLLTDGQSNSSVMP